MSRIAVVILNYNGSSYLKKFLPDVLRFSSNATVWVADNGSTDDSLLYLQSLKEVNLISFKENFGFAEGYNKALQQIEADYYILLNSDVAVTEDWIVPMHRYMNANPQVAACQPKIRSYSDPEAFEYAGACGGFIDKYGYPFCRGRLFDHIEKDQGQYDEIIDVFWATGACLMVRSVDYWEVGGLDGRFFAHMEEIDFCWRLKARGKRVVCVPQSIIYHVGGGTLPVESPHKTFLNFRNNWLLLYKNLTPKDYRKIAFKRRILDYVAGFHFVLQMKPKNAWQIIRAHRAFKKLKKEFTASRTTNLAVTTEHQFPEMLHSLLLKDYFLKGRKRYSDLIF